MRFDTGGNFVWARAERGNSGTVANAIKLDPAGYIYTTGSFSGTSDFDPGPGVFNLNANSTIQADAFILKLDTAGSFLWAKQVGGNGSDYGTSLDLDGNKNLYVAGHFLDTVDFDPGIGVYNISSFGREDAFILKLDSSGNFVWARKFGGPGSDYALSVAVDTVGNAYITGSFTDTVSFAPGITLAYDGLDNIYIAKYNPSGIPIWAIANQGSGYGRGSAVVLDKVGNLYATGFFFETVAFEKSQGMINLTAAGSADIYLARLDTSGKAIWAIQQGGNYPDYSNAICIDQLDNIYLTGTFQNAATFAIDSTATTLVSNGSNDIFFEKIKQPRLAISSVAQINRLAPFPNPTTGLIHLELPVTTDVTIIVMNSVGQTVYSTTKQKCQQVSLDMSNQPAGVYYLGVSDKLFKEVFKIVKIQ